MVFKKRGSMWKKIKQKGGQKCLEDIRDPRTDLGWLEPE